MMAHLKKSLALLLAFICLCAIPLTGLAEWTGEVIARQITFRETPKSNGKKIGSINNGESFAIIDEETGGWFHILYNGQEGYVMSAYVVENPDHMTLLSSTAVYPYPGSDKRVGAIASYTRLTIIDQYDGYYVVNLREASGFIRIKNAKVMLDSQAIGTPPLGTIEITHETTPRNGPSAKQAAAGDKLSVGESYEYINISGDWYIIKLNGQRPAYVSKNDCKTN